MEGKLKHSPEAGNLKVDVWSLVEKPSKQKAMESEAAQDSKLIPACYGVATCQVPRVEETFRSCNSASRLRAITRGAGVPQQVASFLTS